MTKLAERLFHGRKHTAENAEDPRVGWAAAPAGMCDICGAHLDGKHGHRVPGTDFGRAIQQGYSPSARVPVPDMRLVLGLSAEENNQFEQFVGLRMMARDWGLCEACSKDVAAFIAHR